MKLQNINSKKYIDVCSAGALIVMRKHDCVFKKLGKDTYETKFVYWSIRPEIDFEDSTQRVLGCTSK